MQGQDKPLTNDREDLSNERVDAPAFQVKVHTFSAPVSSITVKFTVVLTGNFAAEKVTVATKLYLPEAPGSPAIAASLVIAPPFTVTAHVTPYILAVRRSTICKAPARAGIFHLSFELVDVPLIVTVPPVAGTAGLDESIVVTVPAPAWDTAIVLDGFVPFTAVTVTVVLRATRPP